MPSVAEAVAKKVMIIGLDCAEPSLVLDRWRDRLPVLSGLMERGRVGPAHLDRAADHGSGVVVHDGEPNARRPRRVRLPEPRRPHVRRRVHRRRERDQGATAVGSRRPRGRKLDRGRRPGHVSPSPVARRARQLLPHPLGGEPVHVPAGAQGRGRARRRGVPLRLHELPHGGQGRPAAAGLRDDRPALPARGPPPRDEAVAALRLRRDGHRPDPSRLLEVHGPRAPQARAGRAVRARDPRLLRARRRARRRTARRTRTTRRSCSSSPITARSGWTAGSA